MQTTPGYTEPRLAERHASESGVLTAEAVAARLGGNRGLADPQPGARRPAWGRVSVSLWGQASGLFGARGRGGGAGAGVCVQQNLPQPERGTVLSSGLRRRPAFRRAGGSSRMSSS